MSLAILSALKRHNTEPQTGCEYQERMKAQVPHHIDLALRQVRK